MTIGNIEQARLNMIEQQIRPWEVLDRRVLDVMTSVPRERFVPEAYRGLAFADIEIPLGHGQSMMAPKIEGRMLQALGIRPGENALEIGTGSGFITACLGRLGGRVTSLDIREEFVEQAKSRLDELGFRAIKLYTWDGLSGQLPNTPFDAIAVTGSLPQRAEALKLAGNLRIGGRLFVVIGEAPAMEATLITRTGEDDYREEYLFETLLPALENASIVEHFTF